MDLQHLNSRPVWKIWPACLPGCFQSRSRRLEKSFDNASAIDGCILRLCSLMFHGVLWPSIPFLSLEQPQVSSERHWIVHCVDLDQKFRLQPWSEVCDGAVCLDQYPGLISPASVSCWEVHSPAAVHFLGLWASSSYWGPVTGVENLWHLECWPMGLWNVWWTFWQASHLVVEV